MKNSIGTVSRETKTKSNLPVNQIIEGNVIDVLRTLTSESIDMVVTSPPYWGLRSYGTHPQVWGGDSACVHEWSGPLVDLAREVSGARAGRVASCSKCNAWRGELGLEPYFFTYVAHLCDVFDEVKRVLKPTGTLWVNLGDTYGTNGGFQKSLCQIPSRFAIEMCARGWILRNELIWWKPNCMPSSVKDRFVVDFEKLFFFSKSRTYFFETQHEPSLQESIRHHTKFAGKRYRSKPAGDDLACKLKWEHRPPNPLGRIKRSVWRVPTHAYPEAHFATYPPRLLEVPMRAGCPEFVCTRCGKPRESVYEGKTENAFNIRVRDVKEGRMKHVNRRASADELASYDESAYGGEGRKFAGYTNCGCNAGFRPGIVLDPFMGSGTTALVALKLNRSFIGIDLLPEYVAMAKRRIREYLKTGRQ